MAEGFENFPPHPLTFNTDTGANGMKAGEIVQHRDGRKCRLDEALHDGDAFVTWEDGTWGETKWYQLEPMERI